VVEVQAQAQVQAHLYLRLEEGALQEVVQETWKAVRAFDCKKAHCLFLLSSSLDMTCPAVNG